MKVAIISTEMVPFSKVGGLADVIGSLPLSLQKYLPITVVTPYYGQLTHNFYKKFTDSNLTPTLVKTIQILNYNVDIYSTKIQDVNILLVYNKELFEREGIYLDKQGKPYPDEAIRYYVFSKAAIEMVQDHDIVHCNDWHTSFAVVTAKLKNLKTIFTIHNMAYQGIFEKHQFEFIQDNKEKEILFSEGDYYGKINLMKASIQLADIISTVSPTYAYEIQNFSQFGMGLENILKQNSHKLIGILNGIDYDLWNPEKDKNLYQNYSKNNLHEGKNLNKTKLLEELKLKNANILFGIVARLDYQKGFDILSQAIESLEPSTFNLVVLGTGNPEIQNNILQLAQKYPDYISVTISFDESLARKIYASSDFFIIPSRFEPCGLSQMISYRYGTIPIATKTGGLKDSIIDIFENPTHGTGILIDQADPQQLAQALKKAIQLPKEKLYQIRERIVELDYSWNRSAQEYLKMYRSVAVEI
ncbi:MAG: glycogen/starch synthase [bacterium]